MTGLKVTNKAKYLGIWITMKNINLYKDSYVRVWSDIKKELESGNRLKLITMGKNFNN